MAESCIVPGHVSIKIRPQSHVSIPMNAVYIAAKNLISHFIYIYYIYLYRVFSVFEESWHPIFNNSSKWGFGEGKWLRKQRSSYGWEGQWCLCVCFRTVYKSYLSCLLAIWMSFFLLVLLWLLHLSMLLVSMCWYVT